MNAWRYPPPSTFIGRILLLMASLRRYATHITGRANHSIRVTRTRTHPGLIQSPTFETMPIPDRHDYLRISIAIPSINDYYYDNNNDNFASYCIHAVH